MKHKFRASFFKGAFLFLLVSCSLFNGGRNENWNESLLKDSLVENKDDLLLRHLESLGEEFVMHSDVKVRRIKKRSRSYFQKTSTFLIDQEKELFTKLKDKNLEFYIVYDPRPFHFSFPGGKIFFSKGLLKKYIEHESFLKSVMLYELIRLEKNIYRKSKTIPIGFYNLSYIVSLNRLPFEIRSRLNKWTYSILERNAMDSGAFIQWIQIINSNVSDFSFYLGDRQSIIREEKEFKDFVIKYYGEEVNLARNTTSSREFYIFKRGL